MHSYSIFRSFSALALSGLFAASGALYPSHLLRELDSQPVRSASPAGEPCQPGEGHGLVPDHSLRVEPLHVCVLCKVFKGALYAGAGLTEPLLTSTATAPVSRSEKLHFAGFFRLSRSPPARS